MARLFCFLQNVTLVDPSYLEERRRHKDAGKKMPASSGGRNDGVGLPFNYERRVLFRRRRTTTAPKHAVPARKK